MPFGHAIAKWLALPGISAMLAMFGASAASATNESYQFNVGSCSPVYGCTDFLTFTPSPIGYHVGGGYAFAGGYNGGFALASAAFAPGAPQLLPSGLYRNYASNIMYYTFQVRGAPDTLVPLRMIGKVSVSPIHLTDPSGNVATLVDNVPGPPPSDRFRIVGHAQVQVGGLRRTTFPRNGAAASFESRYFGNPGFGNYCTACGGGSSSFDETVWVYSNSDIGVTLQSSASVEYMSYGWSGISSIFGTVSAETDPVFLIDDPAYAAFSIVGVPTGAPPPVGGSVPEPASWALLVAGFGLIGGRMRRRTCETNAA